MEVPVYLFTGFLEAGKTRLIQETMEDPDFNAGERTLILLCEEGEEELEPASFARGIDNIVLRRLSEESEINQKTLAALVKESKARRVLVEFNGMWTIDNFYRELPKDWRVFQEIMLADATTFSVYNANMRQLTVDKLKGCELVIFNRCTEDTDTMALHKLVRGVSRNANIAYEQTDGSVVNDDIEDPLPFDLDAAVVEIEDRDFAIFFRDLTEDVKKYDGKTLRYRALIGRDKRLSDREFVAGRQIMTCCADDIAYNGLICKTEEKSALKHGDWAIVEARVVIEPHALYRNPGPVLHVISTEPAEAPDEPVASFY